MPTTPLRSPRSRDGAFTPEKACVLAVELINFDTGIMMDEGFGLRAEELATGATRTLGRDPPDVLSSHHGEPANCTLPSRKASTTLVP